jgi:hypothetical protein
MNLHTLDGQKLITWCTFVQDYASWLLSQGSPGPGVRLPMGCLLPPATLFSRLECSKDCTMSRTETEVLKMAPLVATLTMNFPPQNRR